MMFILHYVTKYRSIHPTVLKLAERQVIPDCLIRRLLGKPQEDWWQITTTLLSESQSLFEGWELQCWKFSSHNRMKEEIWESLEWYLFILCNNGCGFLDLRFCLLQLLPEDFLQLGIKGEKLHSTLTEPLKFRLFSSCLAVFTTAPELLLMKFQFSDNCLICSVYKYWLYQW